MNLLAQAIAEAVARFFDDPERVKEYEEWIGDKKDDDNGFV